MDDIPLQSEINGQKYKVKSVVTNQSTRHTNTILRSMAVTFTLP